MPKLPTPEEIAQLITEDVRENNGLLEAGEPHHPGVKKMPKPTTATSLEPMVYQGQMYHVGGAVPVHNVPSGELGPAGGVVADAPKKTRRPMFSLGQDNKYELVGYIYSDGMVALFGTSTAYEPKGSRPTKSGGSSTVKCVRVVEKDPKTGTRTVRYCRPELRNRMDRYAQTRSKRGYEVEVKSMSYIPKVSDDPDVLKRLKDAGKKLSVELDCKPRHY